MGTGIREKTKREKKKKQKKKAKKKAQCTKPLKTQVVIFFKL
jgi:hypothetical protein